MIRDALHSVTPPTAKGLRSMVLPDGRSVAPLCPENTRIAYDEIFDERIYEMFGIELADGATVFDVGANIGLAVLWVGDRIGRGTVHAFEPIPVTFAALERNVGRHPHLNVHLHHAGVADRDGTATFTFYPRTSTSSSMYPDDSPEAHAESARFILADMRRRLGAGDQHAPLPARDGAHLDGHCLWGLHGAHGCAQAPGAAHGGQAAAGALHHAHLHWH
jgi:hypothetical protein